MNIYLIFFNSPSYTGKATSSTGAVVFSIEGEPRIEILSPLNQTYNMTYVGSPYGPFVLDLNVTSNMGMDSWIYSLYDERHGEWKFPSVAFFPNTTINAIRWENYLLVNASIGNKKASDDVRFFIWYPNTAPILGPISDPIYICEGTSLNYKFTAVDADENLAEGFINPNMGIFSIGGIEQYRDKYNLTLYSFPIDKIQDIPLNQGNRTIIVNISVTDREYLDSKRTNITLLEINNPPYVEDVPSRTIWDHGENATLFEDIIIDDLEYRLGHGVLRANITIFNSTGNLVNLFNMTYNGTFWIINFTATPSTPKGNYSVYICANDTGILTPYPGLLNICGQNGLSQTTCDYFSLGIANTNRPPTIIDHYPDNNGTINISSTDSLYFNITKYDPDFTIPDSFWYVDGNLITHMEGSSVDELKYYFGCDVSGKHSLRVDISDGELNDSMTWNFSVSLVPCSSGVVSSGGGGGGGAVLPKCNPKWVCNPWSVCQNAEQSLNTGLLSGADFRGIQADCDVNFFPSERCGFQIRECVDAMRCNSTFQKPSDLEFCYYTSNPRCGDKIKNCHDGDCELLVDCGGPCESCPSCTDKIKNQGELGVDCGGPCPWRCIPEVPFYNKNEFLYFLALLLLIIIIIIIVKLLRVLRYKKIIKQSRKPNV